MRVVRGLTDASMRPAIPILMYHEVAHGDHGAFRKYVVSPEAFRRQMAVLSRLGYRPITMDALVANRRDGRRLDGRPVVISFDDGFAGVIDHAVPVLEAHGFTAMFYLVSDLVGTRSRWLHAERGVELGLFDWSTARSLQSRGFGVGSHSATHSRLPALDDATCRAELEGSRATISDHLGQEVADLAYPFGAYDRRVQGIAVDCGYRSACSVLIGLSPRDDDLLALRRVPVDATASLLDFVARLTTGRLLAGAIGSSLHRARRTLASMKHGR